VIVTVVGVALKLAGVFHSFTVQLLKIYHFDVSGVALIVAVSQCLYVPPPVTELIHVHSFNVNTYVFLAYQHAYVVLLALALAAFVAALVPGFHSLVIFLVLGVLGAVHRLANVRLVPLGIT